MPVFLLRPSPKSRSMNGTMSDRFIVQGLGGVSKLSGTIAVNGAKNEALKVFAAALLMGDGIVIRRVPDIEDIRRMVELLREMGVVIEREDRRYAVVAGEGISHRFSKEIAKQLRASIVATGPLLARYGEAIFPHPGGCVIGARPIDLFIDGYKKMGAEVSFADGYYHMKAPEGGLRGTEIFFKQKSVGATETLMLAAVLARGTTTIKNAACEPEIAHLAEYLNSCGAKIKGAGTDTLVVEGVVSLSSGGRPYELLPDRIETGSFLILGALAADDLTITDCRPDHVEALIEELRSAGADIETTPTTIRVRAQSGYKAISVKTHEYPGFPTDLQAPMTVFLTQTEGQSLVFETIFEGRLQYVEDLARMGANVTLCDPHRIIVQGKTPLRGRSVESPDIRAGLAFLVAGIIAEGETVIHNVYKIDRGYERVEERLKAIGVQIARTSE